MNLKKILALVLVLAMLVSMVPTYAFAEDVELWDEEEVAVQDDAALEDVYLDEEPEEVIVEDEPEATEPEAVEVEEPAAEEPAAVEEPAAAAVTEAVAVEETNDFDAADNVAFVEGKAKWCTSFSEAVSIASDTDVIMMVRDDTAGDPVTITKNLRIYPGLESATITGKLYVQGDVTLDNINTTAIDVLSGKLIIAAGDNGNYGTVTDARSGAKTGDIKGGTFTSLSRTLLASNAFVENDDGTGSTVSGKVQIAVARVADKVSGTHDYSADGKAYGTIAEAVTEALKAENKVLVILANPADTDAVTLKADETLNIYYGKDVVKLLTVNAASDNCYFDPADPAKTAEANGWIYSYNCKAYAAMWHKDDGKITGIQKAKNFINYNCIYGDGYVEFFVKPESKVTLKAPTTAHKTVKVTVVDNEFAPDIAAPDKYALDIDNTTVPGKIVYTLVEAVASYEKPKTADPKTTETTYTATFNKAATEAAKLVTDHKFAVELYKAPAITEETKDTYTMTEAGVLTVKATDTDILADYAKFVVGGAGVTVAHALSEDGKTATYTATAAKARIDIPNENPEYFPSFQDAAQYIASSEYEARKDLIITVLAEDTWEISAAWKTYPIKVNEGLAKISVKSVGPVIAKGTDATGCTLYTVIDATASYKDADDKEVFTDSFKAAAEEAEKIAVAAITDGSAPTYEVKLYQIPNADTLGDVYEMANGTLKVATGTDLDAAKWTKAVATSLVTAKGENKIIKVTFDANTKAATYTVKGAVAKAALNDGTTEYYETVAAAVNQSMKHPNEPFYIVPIEDGVFKVTASNYGTYLGKEIRIDNSGDKKIKLAEFKAADGTVYAYSETRNEEYGYTTYVLTNAVASIPMTAELDKYYDSVDGDTKYFATFKEAVAADSNAVITLVATPTDADGNPTKETYELGIPDGPTSVQVKLGEFTGKNAWLTITPYGETALITENNTPEAGVTTYSVGTAVASITTGTGASAKTTYYPTFEAAAKVGAKASGTAADKIPVIKLMADIEDTYELDTTKVMKVEKAGKNLNVAAKNDPKTVDTAPYTVVDETDEDGITTYTPELAVASIGTSGEDIKYYSSFTEAATDSAKDVEDVKNPKTITLYQDSAYVLGKEGNVSVLKVTAKNSAKLDVTSGVAKQAVSKSTVSDVTTYTLNADAAAYVTETGKADVYYDTLAEAQKEAEYTIASTSTKQLVLLKEVKTYIVGNDKQVNIKQGDIVPGEVKVAEGYIKVETPSEDGTVINYKSKQAVASVASVTPAADEKPTYYATFAEAAEQAFVAEGTEPTKVVTLIQKPETTDKFEVESVGSVLIDVKGKASAEIETIANIQKNNFKLADGLFSANDKPASGKPYTVTITSAIAKVIKNNGEPAFYNSIANAAKVSNAEHPIVLLANDLSYALAAGTTIYVVKGENEFTVTKVNPSKDEPKVAIEVEELADGVTKYTAVSGEDIVAYINFQKTVDKGDFDTQTVDEYVYYTNFADAVEDADNGEYVIVLERAMKKTNRAPIVDETYVIESADEVVRVQEDSAAKKTALIAPADGFALNKEAEKNADGTATGVNKYTVFNSVAKVNAKHDGASTASDKNYPDLTTAIDDALKLGGTLTLLATPPLGFTYELVNNEYREDKLVLGASQYKFSRNHFTVAEGQYVDGKFDGTAETLTVKTAVASVGEAEEIKYFDTFEAAVAAAQALEDSKGNNDKTKDKTNPTAVISLYIDMDETAPYAIGNTVNSLLVKDNGHKISFNVPDALKTGYFVEKTGSSMEGVNLYKLAALVASVTTGTGANATTVDYSTFKAAAEAAFNKQDALVTLKVAVSALAADDNYEMPVGTLNVLSTAGDAAGAYANLQANGHIVAKGERVFLNAEWIDAGYCLFTVSGAVASITKQSGTTFYYDIADAIAAALKSDYVAITPLTDIDVRLDNDDLTKIVAADGKSFNVEDSEYSFSVKTDATPVTANYELVKDGNKYTFKTAVAYVVSGDEKSVDPDTNEPTYYNEYFATIASASAYASNANAVTPKTIVLLKDSMTYELQSENEVVVAQFGDTGVKVEKFTVSADVEGSTVSDELTTEGVIGVHRGIHTYKLAKLETITLIAGEGAWGTGAAAEHQKSAQTYAGGDLLKLADYAGMVYEPEREGYTLVNWTGNDGNTYVWKFSGLTEDEIAAGYKVLPSVMPEGGLELKANWKANEYWVVLSAEHDASASFVAFKGTYGEKLTLPEDLSAIKVSGYDFDSWYKYDDTSFTTPWNFSNDLFVNTDTVKLIDNTNETASGTATNPGGSTFNMLAKKMPAVQTITWNFEGGTPDPDSKYPEKYLITDDDVTIAAPSREGYIFAGWNLKIDGVDKGTVAGSDPFEYELKNGYSGNRVFTAIWKPIEMKIKWVNDTIVLKETTAKVGDRIDPLTRYGDTPTDPKNTKNVVDLTKDGYRLDPNNLWNDYDGIVPYDESLTWVYHLNWIEQIPVSFFVDDEVTTINVDKNSSLAENKDVPAPTKEGYTLVWTLKGEQYDMTAAVSEKMTLVGEWVEGEDYSDYATISPSLSLEENINMNAYVKIKEGTDPADYDVLVTFDGETTKEGTLADLGDYSRGEYKLSDIAVVAAPQMNVPAVVTIAYKGVEVISNAELTVRAYAEDWIERSTTDNDLRELLIALLDFGAYSQLQFNYDTTNLANSKYSSGIVPSTVVPTFEVRTEGSVSGISGSKIALTLVSDTTMNMYFAAAKKGSYQFKIDGEEASATYSKKEYKVALPKIAVAELGDTHAFTVTGGNATMTVTAAPLAYAYQHQNDSGDLGNVCKAVYLYYLAAVAYFG